MLHFVIWLFVWKPTLCYPKSMNYWLPKTRQHIFIFLAKANGEPLPQDHRLPTSDRRAPPYDRDKRQSAHTCGMANSHRRARTCRGAGVYLKFKEILKRSLTRSDSPTTCLIKRVLLEITGAVRRVETCRNH